jgi:hypothetical protein
MSTQTLENPDLDVIVTPSTPPVQTVRPQPDDQEIQIVTIEPTRRITKSEVVDIIAMFNVIEKVMKGYEEGLKADMTLKRTRYADGTSLATADLRPNSSPQVIDPLKFYQLCVAKGVDLKDIMGCISVAVSKAEKVLSGKDVESICAPGAPKAASLYVMNRKGAPIPSAQEAAFLLAAHFESAAAK